MAALPPHLLDTGISLTRDTPKCILLANNALIVHQFATGYVLENSAMEWDDRMHILINISSCGTLIGQALTKTAFAVTLLRMSNQWQKWVLWFCIVTMNLYMVLKVLFQWAKVCDKNGYDNWYRLDFCIYWSFRDKFKEGGNGSCLALSAKQDSNLLTGGNSVQHYHGFRLCLLPVADHAIARDAKG